MTQTRQRRPHRWSPQTIEHFAQMIETDEKLGIQHPVAKAHSPGSNMAAALMPEEFDQWESLNWHFGTTQT